MIGILSDAHGHAAAFDRALEVLRAEGAEAFVFLGDAVGYIPSADVLNAVRDLGDSVTCVMGNHDEMVLSGAVDHEREPLYQHVAARATLTEADRETMAGWPVRRTMTCRGGEVLFVHGSPVDPLTGYVYEDTELAPFAGSAQFVFLGHTHRPFVRRFGPTLFVNVGSCGLPRDERALGAAALFDEDRGTVRLVRFDLRALNASLLAATFTLHPAVRALLTARGAEGGAR